MRISFLFSLLAVFNCLQGQDSLNKFTIGLEAGWSVNNFPSKGNYLAAITLSGNKHTVFVGPLFINNPSVYSYVPLTGVQAGIQLFPNGKRNMFNLFFGDDINFLQAKLRTNYSAVGNIKSRTTNYQYMFNYFSFGFRFNILRGLYFKTLAGIGFGVGQDKVTTELWNGKSVVQGQTEANFDFGGLVKIGLGCDFVTLGKKY